MFVIAQDAVKNYYALDLEMVAKEARIYARSAELSGDGENIWVFMSMRRSSPIFLTAQGISFLGP